MIQRIGRKTNEKRDVFEGFKREVFLLDVSLNDEFNVQDYFINTDYKIIKENKVNYSSAFIYDLQVSIQCDIIQPNWDFNVFAGNNVDDREFLHNFYSDTRFGFEKGQGFRRGFVKMPSNGNIATAAVTNNGNSGIYFDGFAGGNYRTVNFRISFEFYYIPI